MPKADSTSVPVSEVVKIDRQISDVARRISSGQKGANDFSDMNDLIKRRADLMIRGADPAPPRSRRG
jgi:hypothetical protein